LYYGAKAAPWLTAASQQTVNASRIRPSGPAANHRERALYHSIEAHIFTFLTVSSEHGAQEESLTSLLYRWPHTAALRFPWCIRDATHGSRLPPMITYIYCQIAYRRDIIPYHIACKRRPAFVARLAKLHRFPLTWPQRPALYGSYSCGNADSGSASLLSLSPLTDSLHTGLWVPLLLCFSLNFFSQLPLLYSS
jgi:hypothetical protein